MLISSQYLCKNFPIIRTSIICCYQSTNSSLASILFPEPKPPEKTEVPISPSTSSPKATTKQQAQNVVSSAADAAANVLGVGWDALSAVSNRITGFASSPRKPASVSEQLKSVVRIVTPETLEQRTKSLIASIKAASSTLSQATRIEELSTHLLHNPDANYFTKKERIIPHLLHLRQKEYLKPVIDKPFISIINECLTLANYVPPPRGKGIRLLSVDGGGMRGLVAINALRRIEDLIGEPSHKLFDYMCGVSTGGVITAMLAAFKADLNECEELYKHFSTTVFQRNKALGIGSLITHQSYYDTKGFEDYLRRRMGERLMIKSSLDSDSPKFSLISALTTPSGYKLYLFRNYSILMSPHAHYDGTSKYKVWEAVRASTCAPGYFEEYLLDGHVFQDGGVIANNPTSIALHECKVLWPGENIQCVVSLGNGRPAPDVLFQSKPMSLKQKLSSLVDSVTNTETIHVCLHDLLPTNIYFRLNPFMSADFVLDEHRPERIEQMLRDAKTYIRQNEYKFLKLSEQLARIRSPIQRWKSILSSSKQEIEKLEEQSENVTVPIDDIIRNNDDELQSLSPTVICDTIENSTVPSVIEALPDEILLDIISYLKPFDIYHSLHNLNNRFNSIINDFQLIFNLDISHISKQEFDYCLSSILPLPSVLLRLHSLHISNDETYGAVALFIRQYPSLNIPSLRSLSLTDATVSQIKFLLQRLSTQLEHISIVTNRTIDMNDKRLLCQLVLKHKTLRSCRLSLCDGVDCDESILNNSINNQLENIIIDLSYFQNILTLLSYIPNVKRLTININQQKYYNQDYDAAAFDIFRLCIPTQLTYFNLNLRFSNVEFEHIEQLLNCLVNLKHLCCSSFRAELVDGYRWAQVLERLPQLKRFECVMTTYIYHSLDLKLISKSFQTSFWKQRNWTVVCDYFQYLSRLIIYTIPFYKDLFTSTLNGSQLLNEFDDESILLPANAYDKVTHLKVSVQGLHSENVPVRKFRFVTSLSLCDGESYSDHSNSSLLSYLTSTVDLTKIRHLKLYSLLSGHTLFSLLCKAPNIDCLSSSYHNLLQMINDFGDAWLCWLLNMMIKRLTLSYGRLTLPIVDQFIGLFSNIEHLSLCMNMDDVDFQEILLKLLKNLTHLSSIRISLAGKVTDQFQTQTCAWLSTHQKLHSEFNDNFLDIWIT